MIFEWKSMCELETKGDVSIAESWVGKTVLPNLDAITFEDIRLSLFSRDIDPLGMGLNAQYHCANPSDGIGL